MINTDLDDILNLLAATIIADKRVFAAEIDTFIKAANSLKIARLIEPRLSETRLLSWYEMNKEALKGKIISPYFKTWFYGCLDRLAHIKDKQDFLSVMQDIAISDGELHVSERALIVLTELHWNIESRHYS